MKTTSTWVAVSVDGDEGCVDPTGQSDALEHGATDAASICEQRVMHVASTNWLRVLTGPSPAWAVASARCPQTFARVLNQPLGCENAMLLVRLARPTAASSLGAADCGRVRGVARRGGRPSVSGSSTFAPALCWGDGMHGGVSTQCGRRGVPTPRSC